MIEGRSGGSWRGTRRELWAPLERFCSTSESHVVSCTDARPSPPTHFPPSAASSPSHLPAGHGEKFRRTQAHGSLVAAEWRAQRENDRREERGIWAGHSKRIEGPTWQRFFNQRIARCIVYRRPTLAAHSFPSLRRFLTLAPACWSRGKIPPHPSARSARHSSPQNGGPKGKMIYAREPVYSPKIIQRNATGSERTRRSVPSIHFLDIDLTPCSRSHLLIAAESNRTQEPTRNDGINPRFARRKIVMRDI